MHYSGLVRTVVGQLSYLPQWFLLPWIRVVDPHLSAPWLIGPAYVQIHEIIGSVYKNMYMHKKSMLTHAYMRQNHIASQPLIQ